MPRCPNCDYSEVEDHDLYPDRGNDVETYLVCPDCGVVIG